MSESHRLRPSLSGTYWHRNPVYFLLSHFGTGPVFLSLFDPKPDYGFATAPRDLANRLDDSGCLRLIANRSKLVVIPRAATSSPWSLWRGRVRSPVLGDHGGGFEELEAALGCTKVTIRPSLVGIRAAAQGRTTGTTAREASQAHDIRLADRLAADEFVLLQITYADADATPTDQKSSLCAPEVVLLLRQDMQDPDDALPRRTVSAC
ncbi:hypothetical protein OH76DRAFT_1481274 [Lentinus brumalis]|uniref:Uncharacterized protein n=1 Tax=Lentinus brumalis TaxID=2498619 RepID=A0A371DGX3_9APHY|nr:hypothetical protein OH76DRAFT_1481274 [Polyporus brumalis]